MLGMDGGSQLFTSKSANLAVLIFNASLRNDLRRPFLQDNGWPV